MIDAGNRPRSMTAREGQTAPLAVPTAHIGWPGRKTDLQLKETVMKCAAIMMAVSLLFGTGEAHAEDPADQPAPVRLWLVVDTSPSTKEVTQELRIVAQAAAGALQAGDRLRLLAAHADRAHLHTLEAVGATGVSRVKLAKALAKIRPAAFLRADVAAALRVVRRFLRDDPAGASSAIVLVLTNAEFKDKQAKEFLAAVGQLESLGARAYCTGEKDTTKALLIAAAQGRLKWTRLADSTPGEWIAQTRVALRKDQAAVDPVPADEAATPHPARPEAESRTSNGGDLPASEKAKPRAQVPSNPARGQPVPLRPCPTSAADETKTAEAGTATTDDRLATAEGSAPAQAARDDDGSAAQGDDAPAAAATPFPAETAALSEASTMAAEAGARQIPSTTQAPTQPAHEHQEPFSSHAGDQSGLSDTVGAVTSDTRSGAPTTADSGTRQREEGREDVHARARIEDTPPEPVPSLQPRRPASADLAGSAIPLTPRAKKDNATGLPAGSRRALEPPSGVPWGVILLGAAAFVIACGLTVLGVDYIRAASRCKRRSQGPEEDTEADRRELVASVNGRRIALGPLRDIRCFNIGAGARAAVPVNVEGILRRHATIDRDGDLFWLRNRSRAPILANGVPVAPRRRLRLVLPAALALGESAVVRLHVQERPEPRSQEEAGGGDR